MRSKINAFIAFIIMCSLLLIAAQQLISYGKKEMVFVKPDPIKFGATYMTLNNPFFEIIDSEMRNVIEANGDIMITMDPQLSLKRQIEQIHYMMDQGCQVLIVNPVDSKGLIDVLKEAKQKGMVIIAVDTNVYDGNDFIDYTVVSDNYHAGVLCAQHMMAHKEEANILILHHQSAYSATERIQGFRDTIKDYPKYQIVYTIECEGQLEKSMPLVADRLHKQRDFDVVMSLNDPAAMGAIAALQEVDALDGVFVYGVDGTPEAKILVKDGFMMGTVAQYPKKMAKKAVESAYRLLQGHTNIAEEKIEVNMISQKNIDQFSLEGWQ
ncbi:MAG: sugar ABC transporter substrate-binding protein [Erysipelotrichaceae bacterium]|nr:sugar ABC transporter substrate-binding protein [Erysipelotrichaceae bacterium]